MKKKVRFSRQVAHRYFSVNDVITTHHHCKKKLKSILKKSRRRQKFNASFFSCKTSNAYTPLSMKRQSPLTTIKYYQM